MKTTEQIRKEIVEKLKQIQANVKALDQKLEEISIQSDIKNIKQN